MVFQRYEIKYILSDVQANKLKEFMKTKMVPDAYGNSVICNIYFDTPSYLLIRNSIDKPVYKEKIRFRSYGVITSSDKAFLEIKKKYRSIVYKRRITISEKDLMESLNKNKKVPESQIGKEINYCFSIYKELEPKIFISYEREAFYGMDDQNFRITFDKNITWRDYDLTLTKGIYGEKILDSNMSILEVKTDTAIPLWLVRFFSENKIYKTSFSKYGTIYEKIYFERMKGEIESA